MEFFFYYYIALQMDVDVSEELAASIFRLKGVTV
jgi:hypothetical protein